MTIQLGDTGRVVTGPLKTFTTTFASPRETLLGTPTALPTAEPASSQISFTVQASDLPTTSPAFISTKYTAILFSGGKNTDAAAQSVSWRVLKNSTSIATGTQSSIATNTFWTQTYYQFPSVVAGDVLEIRLWSSSANVNYDYYALVILPTQPSLGKSYINKDVNYSNFSFPSLTLGNPSYSLSYSWDVYASNSSNVIGSNSGTLTFQAMGWSSTYNAGRLDYGDKNTATGALTSSTYRPYYNRVTFPATITFREILR